MLGLFCNLWLKIVNDLLDQCINQLTDNGSMILKTGAKPKQIKTNFLKRYLLQCGTRNAIFYSDGPACPHHYTLSWPQMKNENCYLNINLDN